MSKRYLNYIRKMIFWGILLFSESITFGQLYDKSPNCEISNFSVNFSYHTWCYYNSESKILGYGSSGSSSAYKVRFNVLTGDIINEWASILDSGNKTYSKLNDGRYPAILESIGIHLLDRKTMYHASSYQDKPRGLTLGEKKNISDAASCIFNSIIPYPTLEHNPEKHSDIKYDSIETLDILIRAMNTDEVLLYYLIIPRENESQENILTMRDFEFLIPFPNNPRYKEEEAKKNHQKLKIGKMKRISKEYFHYTHPFIKENQRFLYVFQAKNVNGLIRNLAKNDSTPFDN